MVLAKMLTFCESPVGAAGIDLAAERCGLSRSEFMRGVLAAAVADLLGEQQPPEAGFEPPSIQGEDS
ncbi:MAG: hypothetical protein ACRDHL_05340 [Candidatus Promineifilaceae bacterium]